MSRRNKADRRIVAIVSDLHSGHKLGLMNPETELYEDDLDSVEGAPRTTREIGAYQDYLWNTIWMPGMRKVQKLAGRDPICLIVNGDITHGIKYPQQLVTTSIANQFLIAEGTIEPWMRSLKNLEMIRFAAGTGSHIFEESASPVIVSKFLRDKYPDRDVRVVHHGLLNAGGIWIDYAHHGPSQGIREWTKGNQLRYYLKSIMSSALKNKELPPDAVFRSHYHYPQREIYSEFVKNGGQPKTVESRIYLTPSMCGMNDYAYQASRSSSVIYNGFIVLEIFNGKIVNDHLDEFVWMLDLRTKEVW